MFPLKKKNGFIKSVQIGLLGKPSKAPTDMSFIHTILNLKYGTLIGPLRQHLDHGSQILASVSLPFQFQFIIDQIDPTIYFC